MAAALSSYALDDQRRMAEAKNYFAWQAQLVTPELGLRVAEIGCGIGNFTRWLLDRDLIIAVDSDRDALADLEQRYAGRANLQTICADGADLRAVRRFGADSCVCLNVLEHIEDDASAIREMASIIPRGGKIVLIVPAFPSLYGPIDRNLGHFRRYRRATLAALAGPAGLTVEKLRYINLPGFFGWWLNARIFQREEQSPSQIRVFDRYFVPFISRFEKILRSPFGQSIFAVFQKP